MKQKHIVVIATLTKNFEIMNFRNFWMNPQRRKNKQHNEMEYEIWCASIYVYPWSRPSGKARRVYFLDLF